MDIKTQIQQEAEKRYPERKFGDNDSQDAFIEGAEWLDSEIVQPLRKENEGLKAKVDFYREQTEKMREYIDRKKIGMPCQPFFDVIMDEVESMESQLSLSEGEIERLKGEVRKEAIGFAEFINPDYHQDDETLLWERFDEKFIDDQFRWSSDELYNIYLSSKIRKV